MLKTQSEYRTGKLFYYVKLILLVNQKLLFFLFMCILIFLPQQSFYIPVSHK